METKSMQKLTKTPRRFARSRKSITGLSAAIVTMAFFLVACVFAYTVLNVAFLATQRSQEVVMGGLQVASTAIVLDGPIYGYSAESGTGANITSVILWLRTVPGADSVDLSVNKTTIVFQNPRGVWPNIYNSGNHDLTYTINGIVYTAKYTGDKTACKIEWEEGSGMSLDRNEKVRVTIDLTALSAVSATAGEVMRNEGFTIVVTPPRGSALKITRYAPPEVRTFNDLG
jgi:archaellin